MRRNAILLLSIAIAACAARTAQASTIYYTVSADGVSGRIGTRTFTNDFVTFNFQTSTTTPVEFERPYYYLQRVTGTVTIPALHIVAAAFKVPVGLVAFDNIECRPPGKLACFGGLGEPLVDTHGRLKGFYESIMATESVRFDYYELDKTFGPVSGLSLPPTKDSFNTSMGGLVIKSVSHSCFTALVGSKPSCTPPSIATMSSATMSPTPTPEPGSMALFGAGVLGMAGLIRRRLI